MRRRVSGIVLALALCLAILPMIAQAEGTTKRIPGSLDLTAGDHSGKTLADDGYTWTGDEEDGYHLTLSDVTIDGDLKLPDNCTTTVTADVESVITGNIVFRQSYRYDLIFEGGAPLAINGSIRQSGADYDKVTVRNGAVVTVGGIVSTGASGGANGTILVSGPNSSLEVDGAGEDFMTVQNLQAVDGGMVTARCTVLTASVTVGENSAIDITADSGPAVALMNYSSEYTADDIKTAFRDAIAPLLPNGYSVGEGTDSNGGKHYTVLDSEGRIASTLTLEEQPEPVIGIATVAADGETTTYSIDSTHTTAEAALQAAWSEAQGRTAVVTLLKDVTASLTVNNASSNITLQMAEGVTLSGSAPSNTGVIDVKNGVLTVASGTVKNISSSSLGYGVPAASSGGVVKAVADADKVSGGIPIKNKPAAVKTQFHSRRSCFTRDMQPVYLSHVRPEKSCYFVKRNDVRPVIQIRVDRARDNHQLLVVPGQPLKASRLK